MSACVEDTLAPIAALLRLEAEVAELRAAIEGGVKAEIVDGVVDVAFLFRSCRVSLRTDSQYDS